MNEFDDLISRLGAFASDDLDEGLAQKHLAGLASVPQAAPQFRSRARTLVAGALVAGALAGSATMAGAVTGALPDAAQDKVSTALAKVGVDVPKGKSAEAKAKAAEAKAKRQADAGKANQGGGTDRFLGDATTPCLLPGGAAFIGNHGDWVTAHPDDPATADVNEREEAAKSRCGKPVQAGEGSDNGKSDEDHGKPATAGKSGERTPPPTGKPAGAGKPTTTTTVEGGDTDTDSKSGTGGTGSSKARADR
jgi:hypothetical protein